MVENLKDINWQHLTTAHGSAGNVPQLITSLISSSPEVWQPAFEQLESVLWYQGMVYETTALVVPFLIALLDHESVPCKEQIILLLADLALRCSPDDEEQDEDECPWSDSSKRSLHKNWEQRGQQHNWLKKTYDAIAQGTKIYQAMLDHDDPAIRIAVPYIVYALREYSREMIVALRTRLAQETDPMVKASLLFSLGNQMAPISEDEDELQDIIQADNEHLLVRIAAALAHLMHASEHVPVETASFLLRTLPLSQDVEDMYATLPWSFHASYLLTSRICNSFLTLGFDSADFFIAKLLAVLEAPRQVAQLRGSRHANDYAAFDIVKALLYFGFQGKSVQVKDIPFLLTTVQRTMVKMILENEVMKDHAQELADMMEMYGLPSPWKLRVLLGIEVPTAPIVRPQP